MLRRIEPDDLACLKTVIEVAVRNSVADSEEDAVFLIDDILESLEGWVQTGSGGFHRKYIVREKLVAFIVVKDHWNLSHLFVLPTHQRNGIGCELVAAAIESCRSKSPRQKIQVHSSDTAAEFYRACGFVDTGPGIDRPGGCIPIAFRFWTDGRQSD